MGFLSSLSLVNEINLDALDWLQRVLLVCDGTLTDLLSAALQDSITLVKLTLSECQISVPVAELAISPGDRIMQRQILLVGEKTSRAYVYAESLLAIDRLPAGFYRELSESSLPLGRLWAVHRLETFKELLAVTRSGDFECGTYFRPCERKDLIKRTYRVISGGQPIMLISEYFPVSFCKQNQA